MGWPLTKGSLGKATSRGARSVWDAFRDDGIRVVASALPLAFKVARWVAVLGEAGLEPLSEFTESDRGPMGTVTF